MSIQYCCYEYTVGAYSTVVVMSIQYCCYEYTVGAYSTVVVMSTQLVHTVLLL